MSRVATPLDRSQAWALRSWVAIGVTTAWGLITFAASEAASGEGLRRLNGIGWGLACLGGVALGLSISTGIALIGVFVRGRRRWLSALALVICLLAWAGPFLMMYANDRRPPPNQIGPPAGGRHDML